MKVFLNILAAIFSIVIGTGLMILFIGNFEAFIQSFYKDFWDMLWATITFNLLISLFIFCPLNYFIDDYCA